MNPQQSFILSPHLPTYTHTQEPIQSLPIKFRLPPSQIYIKKPPISLKPKPPNAQTTESVSECQCCCFNCQSLFNCFDNICESCNRCQSDNRNQSDEHSSSSRTVERYNMCCGLNCINNEQVCQKCLENICQDCKHNFCFPMNMCDRCKSHICLKCKNKLGIKYTIPLRNYPIYLKAANRFHFTNCKCQKCKHLKNCQNVDQGDDYEKEEAS